jgi:hypothetical protein
MDVHRDFCEVAVAENGRVRSAGRIQTRVPALELFAQSLAPDDVVAMEATTGSDRIVSVLRPSSATTPAQRHDRPSAGADFRLRAALACSFIRCPPWD